jgi:hypothetical protein
MQLLEQGATSSGSLPPIRTVMQSADVQGRLAAHLIKTVPFPHPVWQVLWAELKICSTSRTREES